MYEPLPDLAYFRLLVGDPRAIPLLEAAASIGVIAYPALDLQETLSTFDGLASQVGEHCSGASTDMIRLQRLGRFFYGKLGFAGNINDYYDPDNSFVHRVLETRRGIPITLAVLFTELARHVGLDAVGVPFPGHFLIKVRLHDGVAVIDPFTGQSLDHEELLRRASAQHAGKPSARQAVAGALRAAEALLKASSNRRKRRGPNCGKLCRRKRASSSAGEIAGDGESMAIILDRGGSNILRTIKSPA